jgi:hemerythrin
MGTGNQMAGVKDYKLSWTDDMSTGFPDIDAQHKEWIARYNKFNDAVVHNKGLEVWGETLLFFLRYTETHFRFEEDIIELYNYPEKALQVEQHNKFRSRIEQIMRFTWPSKPTREDMMMLQVELGNWLQEHICTIDVQLRTIDQNRPADSFFNWGIS